MYCKHCGKEIADDSKYCRHCGGYQGEGSIFVSFAKHKTGWILYILWVLINYLMYFLGNEDHYRNGDYFPQEAFFPFHYKYIGYYDGRDNYVYGWFDIDSYDFSEFIIYSFIIPLIIYLVITYRDNIKSLFKKKK